MTDREERLYTRAEMDALIDEFVELAVPEGQTVEQVCAAAEVATIRDDGIKFAIRVVRKAESLRRKLDVLADPAASSQV